MPYGIKQTKNKRYNPYQSSTPGSGGSREPTKYVPRGDTHRFASAASTAMAVAPVAPEIGRAHV